MPTTGSYLQWIYKILDIAQHVAIHLPNRSRVRGLRAMVRQNVLYYQNGQWSDRMCYPTKGDKRVLSLDGYNKFHLPGGRNLGVVIGWI